MHAGIANEINAKPNTMLNTTANFSVFIVSTIILIHIGRMLSHFRFTYFLIGLALGYLVYLVYKPEKEVIRQYPHPEKAKDTVFKDLNGTCYTYTSHEVDCDANESTLKDYPIQGA